MHRWPPSVLLLCLFASSSAQNSDSLAYYKARDSLLANVPVRAEAVVQAADELAAEGLYRDALSMLTELPKRIESDSIDAKRTRIAEKVSAPAAAPVHKEQERPLSWRITGAADYTHLDDINTILDPEKKDSLDRLREEPFTVSSKATFVWKPQALGISSVDPSLYVSNQKAALDFSARFAVAPKLGIDAGLAVEKRLVNVGSAIMGGNKETIFMGDREDSLDRCGGRLTVTPGSGEESGGIKWKTPATVEAARYRRGRAGYYSYNDVRTAPEISFITGDMRKSCAVQFLGEYKDYMSGAPGTITRADSFDIYRVGSEMSGELWRQRFSATAALGFLYERYPHRGVPSDIRAVEVEGLARGRLFTSLEASIRTRYENRSEYDKGEFRYCRVTDTTRRGIPKKDTLIDTMQSSFMLRGHEVEIAPALRWSIISAMSLEFRCLLSRRCYSVADSLNGGRLSAPLFIIESRDAFEPELGFEYSSPIASVRASGAYAIENVPAREYYTLSSNRSWKARGDCMGKLTKRISFSIQADYEFRRYAPYQKNSRKSTNLTAATGFSARF